MRFLLNFWSRTHAPGGIKTEAELRAYATEIARQRKTTVGFFEVRDGKPVLLGAVSGRDVARVPRHSELLSVLA